jgi:hypothetical protein
LTGFFVGVITDLCIDKDVLRNCYYAIGVIDESRIDGRTAFSREPLNSHELRVSSLLY